MRLLHAVCLVLGAALFAVLVREVGAETLLRDATRLGWGVLGIVAVEGVADLLHTAGWQRCFPVEARPRIRELLGPHLAGAAVNLVTPSASLGGEVVRGSLAPREAGAEGVAASLVVNKYAAALADTGLTLAGAAVALAYAPLGAEGRAALLGASVLLAGGVLAFGGLQRRGRLAGLLAARPALVHVLGRGRASRWAELAGSVDRRIADLHAAGATELHQALALHVLGDAIGALQLHLFFTMVGVPSHLATVGTVFLVARAIDVIAFIVPGRIGAQEGARMFAMSLVGIGPSLGLLFSLVLRLEQLVWAGIGFLVYGLLLWSRRTEAGVARSVR